MGNMVGVRHYFIEAFTPNGYISLLPKLLAKRKHTYLLQGGPGTGKSTMIKLIGIQLLDRGYDLDYIRSIRDPDSVAGFLLPKQQICLLDVKEFATDDINFAEGDVRLIDTNRFCDRIKAGKYKNEIAKIEFELEALETKLLYQLSIEYKDETISKDFKLEHIFNKAITREGMSESTVNKAGQTGELERILLAIKKEAISFLFLHALQIEGWLNLAPRYLKQYDCICLETEDPNRILGDIFKETRSMGQAADIVVHPLFTDSLIGIVFPEKNLAIWRGDPNGLEEQGLTDEHGREIVKTLEAYRKKRIELKNLMNKCANFEGMDKLRTDILNSILAQLI
ncbi:hypothetical protein Sgly_3246 [Syntrophobotulus glycolicus DSM 8271]|uniref:ATPase n=1 Tax=Syntrophobotulus glycolicus (strain DSM 8271 / FlGlyR) TaxID=645991 RepID=F0T282_SYNGF|nr:hypothetical protein [Syntrophobotulus glycolicus]ADY57510.1 hypothetical protein Sgly_3246 [Syntrophobotulus glycolicus DSM 8271]